MSIVTITLITVFTIVACKRFQKSKPVVNDECATHLNDYNDVKIVADFSRSGEMLKKLSTEETESSNKDPIYSLIDDVCSSEPSQFQKVTPTTISSPIPYSVPINKADLAQKCDWHEQLGDPAHASNTAVPHDQHPLHHFESCNNDMDEDGYMEMKAGVP